MARSSVRERREKSRVTSATFSYYIREALRRIWVSRRTSFVAMAMIAMSLLILGGFLLVSDNLSRSIDRWQANSRMAIYFRSNAQPEEIAAMEKYLATEQGMERRHFVSSAEALVRFKSLFANLSSIVNELGQNPFPPSFEVQVSRTVFNAPRFESVLARIRGMAGVDAVQLDWEWAAKLRKIAGYLNTVGLAAGGLLALAAIFMIANVIRLTSFIYRDEIEIMRLVGANESVVRGPFLAEGLLQGTAGGALSLVLLYALFEIARYSSLPQTSLGSFLLIGFLSWQKCAALVAGGMAAGLIGSWISLMRRPEET
ncbi:MAG: permease-like cell division protein FtsX [Acidobacteriota bacterium]